MSHFQEQCLESLGKQTSPLLSLSLKKAEHGAAGSEIPHEGDELAFLEPGFRSNGDKDSLGNEFTLIDLDYSDSFG